VTKARLLLVEDDKALAELLIWHFERADFDVRRTGDGEEAASPASKSAGACAARPLPPTCPSSC
jgi:two-component system phosphate regulon response regulator PhoB